MSADDLTTRIVPAKIDAIDGWDYSLGMVVAPETRILDDAGRDWSWAYAIFREVRDFPGYCVGSNSTSWSRRNFHHPLRVAWRRLKPKPDKNGYLYLCLCRDTNVYTRKLYRLILETFIGPRPPDAQCCHFPDRDIRNNHLHNLRWGSIQANVSHRRIHGTIRLGSRVPQAKVTEEEVSEIRRLYRSGVPMKRIAESYPITYGRIRSICYGLTWTHVQPPGQLPERRWQRRTPPS